MHWLALVQIRHYLFRVQTSGYRRAVAGQEDGAFPSPGRPPPALPRGPSRRRRRKPAGPARDPDPDPVAAPVPREAPDGLQGQPVPRRPVVRLAGRPQPARHPLPAGRRRALLRRRVEQRHLLLLHAGAPRLPLRRRRRRHPAPRLARPRRRLPRPRPRRRLRLPRLGQGRLHHLLRGCPDQAPRQMDLLHRADGARDELRAGGGAAGRRGMAGARLLLRRREGPRHRTC